METKNKKFYITTAIDYVNDTIHIGHAFQKVIADFLARYYRIKLGEDNVFFLTGTDEYGQRAEKAAKEAGISTKDFVDKISKSDQEEQDSLNISYNRFIRTTDLDHAKVVQEIWRRVNKSGDIYLGEYTGLYCDGCEAYYTKEDLVNGRCSFHPTLEIKQVAEKNYFFKWSKYRDFLIKHIKSHPEFIIPETRKNEMLEFAKHIKDIPISRTNFKWGIPVPDNPDQVIYVWFDALINYLTGIGFLEDPQQFEKFWPADVHILGKDNIRWHSLLWPAILKSAKIGLPKTILVNGFLNLNGQKISKSIGNIIRPSDWVRKFGVDAVRYYLLRYTTITEDNDISEEKLKTAYNSDLASGIGNLVARVRVMADNQLKTPGRPQADSPEGCNPKLKTISQNRKLKKKIKEIQRIYKKEIEKFKLNESLKSIWELISFCDSYIDKEKPWKNENQELKIKNQGVINDLLFALKNIAELLKPFLPQTAENIFNQVEIDKKTGKFKNKRGGLLFPRI